ncbi:MAG: hypothetical protein WCP85_03390 [Mariniphaga sp.]
MKVNNDFLVQQATDFYLATCPKRGTVPQQPSPTSSEVKRNVIVLNNTNGILQKVGYSKNRLFIDMNGKRISKALKKVV